MILDKGRSRPHERPDDRHVLMTIQRFQVGGVSLAFTCAAYDMPQHHGGLLQALCEVRRFLSLNLHARNDHADVPVIHVDAVVHRVDGCALRVILDNEAEVRWIGIVNPALISICGELDSERLVMKPLKVRDTQIFNAFFDIFA